MLQPRIIPCLLLHEGGLVKTVKFKKPRYVGDPINAVKIFNEKEVDEIILIDIDAAREQREPDYELINDIASEAFMPICYGGNVTTALQMRKIFSLGIEKISISSAAIESPELIKEAATIFGSQSIIVTLDVKKGLFDKKIQVVTHNASKKTGMCPVHLAKYFEEKGAGELLVNYVDRDGIMEGYDIELIKKISSTVNIPVIALGGAGSLDDMKLVIKEGGASAAAAGSLFVFKGVHHAVLINYPSQSELRNLFQEV